MLFTEFFSYVDTLLESVHLWLFPAFGKSYIGVPGIENWTTIPVEVQELSILTRF